MQRQRIRRPRFRGSGSTVARAARATHPQTRPTKVCVYRAGTSLALTIPQAQFIFGQRIEELWSHAAFPLHEADASALRGRIDSNQAGDWLAFPARGNLHLLPKLRSAQQLRKVGLGFEDRGAVHILYLLR